MKTDTEDTVRVTVTLNRMSDPEWYELIKSIKNGRTRADVLRRHLRLPTISIASPAKPSASKLPTQPTQSDHAAPAVQVGPAGGSDEPSNPVWNGNGSVNLVSQTGEKLTPVSFSAQAPVNSSIKDTGATDTISPEFAKRNSPRDELEDGESTVGSKGVTNPVAKETSGVTDSKLTEAGGDKKLIPDQPKKSGMAASMLANGNSWNSGA